MPEHLVDLIYIWLADLILFWGRPKGLCLMRIWPVQPPKEFLHQELIMSPSQVIPSSTQIFRIISATEDLAQTAPRWFSMVGQLGKSLVPSRGICSLKIP